MANVLIDMHKTDAVLAERGFTYNHYNLKSPYYSYILKKHGVTQAEFDSSLTWYSKNPKKFDKVYDKVLVQLTKFQKEIRNGKYHAVDTLELAKIKINIWNKRYKYLLTKDSARTHLDFEITNSSHNLMFRDVYLLKFLQRIAPEDSSKNKRILFRINYENGKIDSVSKPAYNDSLLRRYSFRMTAHRKLKIKSISGQLLGSSAYRGKFNVTIDSLSLTRIFNPADQDSLRRILENKGLKNLNKIQKPILKGRNMRVFEKFGRGKMIHAE